MPPQGILRYTFPYWMAYDEGEDIGRATNYHRGNRSMAVMMAVNITLNMRIS